MATAKPQNPKTLKSKSPSLSSHFAMIELKQRIISSIAKLSDRDTHQVAITELEKIIETLNSDGVPMFLNCLYDASADQKPAVKKESLRLFTLLCSSHSDSASSHLTKIIACIVKRLRDPDSSVRESCRDAMGALAAQFLKHRNGENGEKLSEFSLFVKPLFEAMNEQNKTVQAASAICMAKVVEIGGDPSIGGLRKMIPRICKYLNSQNFLAKSALLSIVSNLSQVGAIGPQNFQSLLQSIQSCLENSDWATRKAAADTLRSIATHSSHLIIEGATSALTVLETCRFDKVKPVRDSMTDALQLWKKAIEQVQKGNENKKDLAQYGEESELSGSMDKINIEGSIKGQSQPPGNDSSKALPTESSLSRAKWNNISDRTVGILRKKKPSLTDKELNPDFFQKLEGRWSGEFPVEVVMPLRRPHSSHSDHEAEMTNPNSNDVHCLNGKPFNAEKILVEKWIEQRFFRRMYTNNGGCDNVGFIESNHSDMSGIFETSSVDIPSQGISMNGNKGSCIAIQRQLWQLERQQANLMNILQDFMGDSHDSIITLENRVRDLERTVEDIVFSSGTKASNFSPRFERSTNICLENYNGFADSCSTIDRGGNSIFSGSRGRHPPLISNVYGSRYSYSSEALRNGFAGSKRSPINPSNDKQSLKEEHVPDQDGNKNIDKGPGPSARSVWRASKIESTLEAIRVASEGDKNSQIGEFVSISPNCNPRQEKDFIWILWSHAMHLLQMGNVDSAYSEVLSSGYDLLLMKLMDTTGPVMHRLSKGIVNKVIRAVGQFLLEQSLLDIGLSWAQQLLYLVKENGVDFFNITLEIKKELLVSLHKASFMEPPEDWEGITAEKLLWQFSSLWGIDFKVTEK